MHENQTILLITFLLYILFMLLIGWLGYKHTRDISDFILGGRRLGKWVTALSAGASDMSGWLLLGLPGYAYVAGFEATWIAAGLLLGTWLNWRFVAQRLRCYSELSEDSLTLPEFLENRFDDHSHVLRIIAAFFILLFFLFYTASGLVAGAKLFTAVFELSYETALLTGALIILIYTLVGGFLAVSWTDLFQGLLMMFALTLVPLVAMESMGGWGPVLHEMRGHNINLIELFTDKEGTALGTIGIVSLMAWGLGYFGQPHILARFKAIKNIRQLDDARRIAITWTVISMLGALMVGFTGIGLFDRPLQGADTEKVFIFMVEMLFHPAIAGILLAAILAAIMSTADSQLLVSASVLAEDFYRKLFRRQASETELVIVGRSAVAVIMLVALSLSWNPDLKVLDMVAYAWAGFGAAFGPTLLLSLYWQRMTRNGALAGMLVGGITVVIWKQLSSGIFDLYEILPGFLLSTIAIVLVSKLDRQPEAAIREGFQRFDSIRRQT